MELMVSTDNFTQDEQTGMSDDFAALPEVSEEPRYEVKLQEVAAVSEDRVVLRLDKPSAFKFEAGQYVWLVLPERSSRAGIIDRRAYSVASRPEDEYIELFIRIKASDYLQAVKRLVPGATLQIIGPFGFSFVSPPDGSVLVSGGTGVAPFLSLLRSRAQHRYTLLIYNRPELADPYYKQELLDRARAHGHRVIFRAGKASKKDLASLTGDHAYLVSGPQGFVNTVAKLLSRLGVEEASMHFEACYPTSREDSLSLKLFETLKEAGIGEGGVQRDVSESLHLSKRILANVRRWSDVTPVDWIMRLTLIASVLLGLELLWRASWYLWLYVTALPIVVVIILWLRVHEKLEVLKRVLVVSIFIPIIFSYTTAQLAGLLEPWALVFPILNRKLLPFREAVYWNIGLISTLILISILGVYQILVVPPNNGSIYQYILAVAFISALTGIYSYREQQYETLLKKGANLQIHLAGHISNTLNLSSLFVMISSQTSNHVVLTDRNGRIMYSNKAAEALTGYTSGEMYGQTPRLWGGLMPASFYVRLWENKAGGEPQSFQVVNRRKDGRLYVALARVTPMFDDGRFIAYVATEEDVTNLRDLDKAKTEFVSIASHQMRSPLAAVRWYAEMLLKGEAGKLTGEQRAYLDNIYAADKRMLELINALLNVSRLERGKYSIDPEKMNVNTAVEAFLDELAPTLKSRQQNLQLRVAPGVSDITFDKKYFEMIVQNLVSNASKYTSNKGSISLTVDPVRKGQIEHGKAIPANGILLQVADSGYGIPQQEQSKIFSKMFRASNISKVVVEGTGLGLYIIKSIVDQCKGLIWFESAEGKGTTFYVFLPHRIARKKGTNKLS